MIDFATGPAAGSLDVRWIHGAAGEPPIQVHAYDAHTYVLRQGKAVHYEAPFLFLLFGNDRAVLFDTGATADAEAFPLRRTVDRLLAGWLADHPRDGYQLIVAHTHAHRDHVAGDGQFADRPGTTVVGTDAGSVRAFFGFSGPPGEVATLDLGGRLLEVVEIPGHHPTSIAVFDRWTGFLLTGDSVYPGRLYAFDLPQFVASLDRLVEFADARPVSQVLGCHIEMSRRPGRDYAMGARHQPDEPPLQLSVAQLHAVREAAHQARQRSGMHVHDDFIIFNGTGRLAIVKLLLHSLRRRVRP